MKKILITILFLLVSNNIFAQTGCIVGDCKNGYGTMNYTGGDKYVGYFKKGDRNGKGIYTYSSGNVYIGEWRDNHRNGQGTMTYPDGTKKSGVWENNELKYPNSQHNSIAPQTGCISGNCYDGKGVYTYEGGDKYEGEYSNGKRHGHGTYTWPSGQIYVGQWKDSKENGYGTMTYANGAKKSGIWENNELKYPDSQQNTTTTTTQNTTTTSSSSSGKVIQLTKNGGVYEIPVSINGVLNIFFILDSGASEVCISRDVALTLIRTKTIVESDFLEGQTYRLADGSTVRSERFKIKKLVIGEFTLYDVSASISNSDSAPMLLGQNVLSRLGKIQIDYTNHTLTIIK